MKLSIIMAVFNESSTVGDTLERVWNQSVPVASKEIVIVESNSTDGSRWICQKFANQKNQNSPGSVTLILQPGPKGKGSAVREGLAAATGDIVLIQDADSEYDTADYPQLVDPILAGRAEFVLGSRHLMAGNWKIRKFESSPLKAHFLNLGGSIFHFLFNRIYGTCLTDPTTMYKVFKRSCIDGIEFVSNRFDFDFELVGKLIRAGYVPLEVPISYHSRGFEEGKKVRMFRDPLTWVRAIVRFRFSKLYREGHLPHDKERKPASFPAAIGE